MRKVSSCRIVLILSGATISTVSRHVKRYWASSSRPPLLNRTSDRQSARVRAEAEARKFGQTLVSDGFRLVIEHRIG